MADRLRPDPYDPLTESRSSWHFDTFSQRWIGIPKEVKLRKPVLGNPLIVAVNTTIELVLGGPSPVFRPRRIQK
jgi:hypothetical protein